MKRTLSMQEWSSKWDKVYWFVAMRLREEYGRVEAEALANVRTAKLMSLRHIRRS